MGRWQTREHDRVSYTCSQDRMPVRTHAKAPETKLRERAADQTFLRQLVPSP